LPEWCRFIKFHSIAQGLFGLNFIASENWTFLAKMVLNKFLMITAAVEVWCIIINQSSCHGCAFMWWKCEGCTLIFRPNQQTSGAMSPSAKMRAVILSHISGLSDKAVF